MLKHSQKKSLARNARCSLPMSRDTYARSATSLKKCMSSSHYLLNSSPLISPTAGCKKTADLPPPLLHPHNSLLQCSHAEHVRTCYTRWLYSASAISIELGAFCICSCISFQYLISPQLLMQMIETDGAQHGRWKHLGEKGQSYTVKFPLIYNTCLRSLVWKIP